LLNPKTAVTMRTFVSGSINESGLQRNVENVNNRRRLTGQLIKNDTKSRRVINPDETSVAGEPTQSARQGTFVGYDMNARQAFHVRVNRSRLRSSAKDIARFTQAGIAGIRKLSHNQLYVMLGHVAGKLTIGSRYMRKRSSETFDKLAH